MTFLFIAFIALLAYTPQVPAGWPRFVYILGLFSLATCIVVWNGRPAKDDDDVRSMAEFKAEKEAREALAEQHVTEMLRKGRPFRA